MISQFHSDLSGRPRYMALGRHYADAIKQIRERGLEAAIEAAQNMGGATQIKFIARGLLKAVENAGDIPSYRIARRSRKRFPDGAEVVSHVVEIPNLTWRFHGRRMVGMIEWLPMWEVTRPAIERPLP